MSILQIFFIQSAFVMNDNSVTLFLGVYFVFFFALCMTFQILVPTKAGNTFRISFRNVEVVFRFDFCLALLTFQPLRFEANLTWSAARIPFKKKKNYKIFRSYTNSSSLFINMMIVYYLLLIFI